MSDYKSEDIVRDEAKKLLNFSDDDKSKSGTGQLTSFKELDEYYFKNTKKKPDGWYFPHDTTEPAIILEAKSSKVQLNTQGGGNKKENEALAQLETYIQIAQQKYSKVIGILYNGEEAVIYKNNERIAQTNTLFNKNYYLSLFNQDEIDIDKIQNCTIRINEILHFKFIMQDLTHRMIFTACALVAERKGAKLENFKNLNFLLLKQQIIQILEQSYKEELRVNEKLKIIKEQYDKITCDKETDKQAISDFIDNVKSIAAFIPSQKWNGEDVMMIFFNEFNRYLPRKPAYGQFFTPEHIVHLMYKITGANYKDKILDAACGSGAFLIKAMGEMIQEIGGITNEEAVLKIHNEHLFGVEISKDLFTLACANMLIHKDGKTNLIQADSRDKEVCEWVKSKKITKVLMNPPYERKYGVYKIIENVLNNVSDGAMCAFLLPDNKLEVEKKRVQKWLNKHSLLKIIKLPENLFGVQNNEKTSIFLFKAHEPQNDKEIFACWIKDDGLETIKNKWRQDIKGKWKNKLRDYWLNVIYKKSGDETCQWLKANEHLSYQKPQEPFTITEQDFKKVVLDYILFEKGINKKDFEKTLLESILYQSDIDITSGQIKFSFKDKNEN